VRPPRSGLDEFVAVMARRSLLQGPRLLRRQGAELLVSELKRRLVEGDLGAQVGAVAPPSATAKSFEPLAGVGESFLCAGALPFELALLSGEQASATLVCRMCERERLGGGAHECAGGTFRRVERVGLTWVRVVLPLGFREVEACLCSRAAAGDVAPL